MAVTNRQCCLEIIQKHQFGGHLDTSAVIHLVRCVGIPGGEPRSEERALYPRRVAEQCTEVVEAERAQVEFCRRLGKGVCRDSIDGGTGHCQGRTILEGIPMVDIVIAETAKIGIAKHRLFIAEVVTCCSAEPERGVSVKGTSVPKLPEASIEG